jgi:hypothetical protein
VILFFFLNLSMCWNSFCFESCTVNITLRGEEGHRDDRGSMGSPSVVLTSFSSSPAGGVVRTVRGLAFLWSLQAQRVLWIWPSSMLDFCPETLTKSSQLFVCVCVPWIPLTFWWSLKVFYRIKVWFGFGGFFWDSFTICSLGWLWTSYPPISLSSAGITGMSHQHPARIKFFKRKGKHYWNIVVSIRTWYSNNASLVY